LNRLGYWKTKRKFKKGKKPNFSKKCSPADEFDGKQQVTTAVPRWRWRNKNMKNKEKNGQQNGTK